MLYCRNSFENIITQHLMKKVLVNIISKIYFKFIILKLYFLNLNKEKEYFSNHSIGFGNNFDYYMGNYNKILNNPNFFINDFLSSKIVSNIK